MVDRAGESAQVDRALLVRSQKAFDWWHRDRDRTKTRATLRSRMDIPCYLPRDDLRCQAACDHAATAATCRGLLAGETHLKTFVRVTAVSRQATVLSGRYGTRQLFRSAGAGLTARPAAGSSTKC